MLFNRQGIYALILVLLCAIGANQVVAQALVPFDNLSQHLKGDDPNVPGNILNFGAISDNTDPAVELNNCKAF